jgi:hypothetical protein
VRTDDVREIVEAAQVHPGYYSLDGDLHEALCLRGSGQQWHLSERGNRLENQAFDTEDEACVYFLKRLFRLWRPR